MWKRKTAFAGVAVWAVMLTAPVLGIAPGTPFPEDPRDFAKACNGLVMVGTDESGQELVRAWLREQYDATPAEAREHVRSAVESGSCER